MLCLWLQPCLMCVCVCLPGPGLLSQHGNHAQGCQTPQRHDRPPTEKGTVTPGLTSRVFPGKLEILLPLYP